jgi:hypothetical protein
MDVVTVVEVLIAMVVDAVVLIDAVLMWWWLSDCFMAKMMQWCWGIEWMQWCWSMQCWCDGGWGVYCNSGLCSDVDGNGCSVDAMVVEVLIVLWQQWFNGVDALIVLWQQLAEIDANKFYWHHHQKFKFWKIWI